MELKKDAKNKNQEKQIIKVGVIGLGGIARNHLFSLTLIENNRKIWGKNRRVKLWAVSDIDKSKIDFVKENFPTRKYYDNPYDLLDDPEINAVYVLTPTKFHKEYAIKAAEKGKNVFVEKPLALTLDEVREMIKARDQYGVKIQAGLVFRSAPLFEYLKHLIIERKEEFGKPLNVAFRDSQWKPYVGDLRAHGGSTWRKDKELAHGGVLFEHVIHDIDGMSYLFGDPISVFANIRYIAGYDQIEDSVAAIFEFKNGMNVSITATWNNIDFDERRMELYFENAYIWVVVNEKGIDAKIKMLDNPEKNIDLNEVEQFYKDLIGKPNLKSEVPGPYYYESIRFFDAIFNDSPCYPALEVGLKAQQIIEKAYESSKKKQVIYF